MAACALARIDLDALRHNFERVRACAPGRQVFAAVKADGYGHGAIPVAAALQAADGFAVARLDEALALRWAGVVGRPIILLSDPLAESSIPVLGEQGLQPLIYDDGQLQRLAARRDVPLTVWIKLDSGMHRLGFPVARARALWETLQTHRHLTLAGWVTHLACADDASSDMTARQVAGYESAIDGLPGTRSIANSAGIVHWPATHADMVRPGIMLYGSSPMLAQTAQALDLRPVMTLTAPVLSVQHIDPGETVGYGATWQAPEPTRIAVVGIGYGDGYPRHAPTGTPVHINGQPGELAGRVSMDMITVRLEYSATVSSGDSATLWGEGLPADVVAAHAGTIAYELFCRLTPRVEYLHVDSAQAGNSADSQR